MQQRGLEPSDQQLEAGIAALLGALRELLIGQVDLGAADHQVGSP